MLLIITLSIFVISQIILSHYAKALNLIDKPDDRKKHEGNIPTVGGVSLFLSLFIFYLLADISQNYKLILLTSLIVFLSGLLDDIFKLSVLTRVLLQLAACLILILNGFRVLYLGEYEILGNLSLGVISIPFSIIAIMLLTNSINWIDGLDGLASIIYLQSYFAINAFLFFYGNNIEYISIYSVLFLNLLIFIFINMNKLPITKSFLGDSGSILIGYLLSCHMIHINISPEINIHPILIAWAVGFPIFNIITVMLLRALKLNNPFSPDRLHLHHVLQDRGINDGSIVLILFSFAAFLSLIGGFIFYFFGSFVSLLSFIFIFILYISLNFIYAYRN